MYDEAYYLFVMIVGVIALAVPIETGRLVIAVVGAGLAFAGSGVRSPYAKQVGHDDRSG
jgi:hypothetical protein